MSNFESNILDDHLQNPIQRRRDLLPTWIKVFTWIFLIFGVFIPIVFVLGIFGVNINLALYGFESTQPLSVYGLVILILFSLKGLVAYGLWFEKEWAVEYAIYDAIMGIGVCVFVMIFLPLILSGSSLSIRLELLALIPYLNKMSKIQGEWKERVPGD